MGRQSVFSVCEVEAQRRLNASLPEMGNRSFFTTKYAKLRIVQSYCHLVIILTKTGCITPETAKRCKAMLGAYLPIAHRVFASREICRSTKLQLAHALLDGILFHGAATWPELSEGCSARLEGVRCRVLPKICQHFRGPDGDGWTDRQVRLECDVPRLEVVFAQSRLLLAARIARNAPDSLRALLQVEAGQDGSWVQMLSRDIENMRSLLPKQLSSIGSLEEDAQAWNRVWCEHPRAWKGLVRKFASASLDFEKQQGFESRETGAVDEAGTLRAEYQCPECAKMFLSSKARATHESRMHGKRRPALAYARDGKCPCCSCDFHSRVRLVHHLSYSSVKCLQYCVENIAPMSREEQQPLDAADAAFRVKCKMEGRSFLAAQVPVERSQEKTEIS